MSPLIAKNDMLATVSAVRRGDPEMELNFPEHFISGKAPSIMGGV